MVLLFCGGRICVHRSWNYGTRVFQKTGNGTRDRVFSCVLNSGSNDVYNVLDVPRKFGEIIPASRKNIAGYTNG